MNEISVTSVTAEDTKPLFSPETVEGPGSIDTHTAGAADDAPPPRRVPLVPARELADGDVPEDVERPAAGSHTDNGLPFPYSRGIFRYRLPGDR